MRVYETNYTYNQSLESEIEEIQKDLDFELEKEHPDYSVVKWFMGEIATLSIKLQRNEPIWWTEIIQRAKKDDRY